MTPEMIWLILHEQHLKTLRRHKISVKRLSEIFHTIDTVWPRIYNLEATEGLEWLKFEGMTKAEAICGVQLYGPIKTKQIELSN
jgi:hypothetical protein